MLQLQDTKSDREQQKMGHEKSNKKYQPFGVFTNACAASVGRRTNRLRQIDIVHRDVGGSDEFGTAAAVVRLLLAVIDRRPASRHVIGHHHVSRVQTLDAEARDPLRMLATIFRSVIRHDIDTPTTQVMLILHDLLLGKRLLGLVHVGICNTV